MMIVHPGTTKKSVVRCIDIYDEEFRDFFDVAIHSLLFFTARDSKGQQTHNFDLHTTEKRANNSKEGDSFMSRVNKKYKRFVVI